MTGKSGTTEPAASPQRESSSKSGAGAHVTAVLKLTEDGRGVVHIYFTGNADFELPAPTDHAWFNSIPPLMSIGTTYRPDVHVLRTGGHHPSFALIANSFNGIAHFLELLSSMGRVEAAGQLMREFAGMNKDTVRTIVLRLANSELSEALSAANEKINTKSKNGFVEFHLPGLLEPKLDDDKSENDTQASTETTGCTA